MPITLETWQMALGNTDLGFFVLERWSLPNEVFDYDREARTPPFSDSVFVIGTGERKPQKMSFKYRVREDPIGDDLETQLANFMFTLGQADTLIWQDRQRTVHWTGQYTIQPTHKSYIVSFELTVSDWSAFAGTIADITEPDSGNGTNDGITITTAGYHELVIGGTIALTAIGGTLPYDWSDTDAGLSNDITRSGTTLTVGASATSELTFLTLEVDGAAGGNAIKVIAVLVTDGVDPDCEPTLVTDLFDGGSLTGYVYSNGGAGIVLETTTWIDQSLKFTASNSYKSLGGLRECANQHSDSDGIIKMKGEINSTSFSGIRASEVGIFICADADNPVLACSDCPD